MRELGIGQAPGQEVVIRHGRMYWPGRPPGAVEEPADGTTRIERIRNHVLLLTVLLYLLFNWGFQQVRFPPVAGGGLPIGELVLFMALVTVNYTRTLGRLGNVVYLLPFMVWWAFGVGRALVDTSVYGSWALRDAAHVMESLYLIAGFAFAGSIAAHERFFAWLPKFLVIGVIYGLLYPVREQIWAISPTITAGNGLEVPIFGSMANTPFLLMMAAAYLILFHGNRVLANLGAVALIGYTLAFFQFRTLYLVFIAVFGFIVLYRRSSIGNLSVIVYIAGLLLALMTVIGLQFEGRLGESFSADFLFNHFMAIFGISSGEYEGVAAAAKGVDQRLEWWTRILEKLVSNPFYMLIGLGYGVPLTDFYGHGGVTVREPHNSYITVLARTGVIGALCWFSMMLLLFRAWHRAFLRAMALGWREGENRLLILMTFFISIWVLALGEDGFEKPYNVIPFYFLWGIVLRIAFMLQQGEVGGAPRHAEDRDH